MILKGSRFFGLSAAVFLKPEIREFLMEKFLMQSSSVSRKNDFFKKRPYEMEKSRF